ncbi:MAG: hypothetical protein ACI30H_06160 [Paludibacteraceae bacterium]
MKKKNFLFAALTVAALSAGLVSCEPFNNDVKNPDPGQPDNGNTGNNRPTSGLVITGKATDVARNSVTLHGSLNTDSLEAVGSVTGWGIEWAYTKEAALAHTYQEATKVKCTTELQGAHANEYAVAIDDLEGGRYVYYSAYVSVNTKYYYGEVDSVHLLSRITTSSNNTYCTVTGAGDYEYGATITLTAEPIRGCYFQQWDDGSTDNPRTVTVTGDATYTAMFAANPNGNESGHEWVDLGLSVKWATCNVGATKPEEYGNYYAWGETTPKDYYYWSTYKWCNGSYDTQTKYCTNSSYGTVDNKTVLDLEDDAAAVNWRGAWRMPTDAEWMELRENCEWTWTTRNGVNGREVTSKINGNSIFLPAAGYRSNDDLGDAGNYGSYWSSSLYTGYPYDARYVYFYSDNVYRYYYYRYYGRSVRPVL